MLRCAARHPFEILFKQFFTFLLPVITASLFFGNEDILILTIFDENILLIYGIKYMYYYFKMHGI